MVFSPRKIFWHHSGRMLIKTAFMPFLLPPPLPATESSAGFPHHPAPQTNRAFQWHWYAAKIEKAEAPLDWCQPALVLERKVRAFNPFPGALISLNGVKIKVWKALAEPMTGRPGCVLSADRHGVVVACGEGALRLIELQKAGGKRLSVGDFLAGNAIKPGVQFDPAA